MQQKFIKINNSVAKRLFRFLTMERGAGLSSGQVKLANCVNNLFCGRCTGWQQSMYSL